MMKCPFLKDTVVRTCEISPVRKMIPTSSISEENQRCNTPDYIKCPVGADRMDGQSGLGACPYLCESMVQHCSAQSATKFIPYNNDLLSKCNNDAHRYCTLYLQRAYPKQDSQTRRANGASPGHGGGNGEATGIEPMAPARLRFSRNHMWLDVAPDGSCHIGVDAFLAYVMGRVENSTFLPDRNGRKPSVTLNVGSADLTLTFPRRVNITGGNYRLRSHPETLTEDPYGNGWLYEGQVSKIEIEEITKCDDLMTGETAKHWMRDEMNRLSHFVHERLSRPGRTGEILIADGGAAAPSLAQHLAKEDLLQLFSLFFTLR